MVEVSIAHGSLAEEINGYDPLDENLDPASAHIEFLRQSTRRDVQNILKSYTGYFDIFNETIQNALDAVETKWKKSSVGYKPKLYVRIDIPNRKVRVVDNGVGMNRDEFKLCFRPSTSFKTRRESRGHKGVGATFLAYGFSMITLQTKQGDQKLAAVLRGGRDWAEERTNERPCLEQIKFDCEELDHETSGTCVDIIVSDSQRPKLAWLNARNAESWFDVLRIRTPLGGVYLTESEKENLAKPEIQIDLVSADYSKSSFTSARGRILLSS